MANPSLFMVGKVLGHKQPRTMEIYAHLSDDPLQQKYLRAMAELGAGPHKTGEIASALGVEAASVATVRQQLIDKGMVWSQRHGETAFTAPMFDAFMRRQMPMLEKRVPRKRSRRS